MFVDKVNVRLVAGKGGNGIVSFRHEKFVERGGPDGGDGGDGGDIFLLGSNSENTLADFRYKKEIKAEAGQPGGKRKRHGKSAEPTIIKLPVGTVVADSEGNIIADLTKPGEKILAAKGGKGGFGNAHFVSSRRQAPKLAEKGEPGEAVAATFELKMIADVGLVGLPNAGKSTLLSRISNAHPEIANYPFTTLMPHLGVVDVDSKNSLLVADIPGLIAGASKGKGLGDEFLRHVERTSVLIHLIDAYHNDIAESYKTIQSELKAYKIDLSKRPQVIAVNKIEGLPGDMVSDIKETLKKVAPKNAKIYPISAQSGEGIREMLFEIAKQSKAAQKKTTSKKEEKSVPILRLPDDDKAWKISKTKDGFVVTGKKIERFALRTDFNNQAGVERLREIMRKMGIMHELERKKINPGDAILVGKDGKAGSFEY
jgi:GTPase